VSGTENGQQKFGDPCDVFGQGLTVVCGLASMAELGPLAGALDRFAFIRTLGLHMTREEWSALSDAQKLDYLFGWSERLEEAVKRLDVNIQLLEARFKIAAETTGTGTGS
jgi:hypothetical protein